MCNVMRDVQIEKKSGASITTIAACENRKKLNFTTLVLGMIVNRLQMWLRNLRNPT